MKKTPVKGLLVIVEAGIEVLAERIKKRRRKMGNPHGLGRPGDRGAYDLRDRSAAQSFPIDSRRDVRKRPTHRRSIPWE